ncbi:hypothetical protein AABB24_009541, partial [Solanum stoloniferum]
RYRLGFHTEKRQSPQSAASEREGERNMGSREKDQPTPHLSSLVVRPTDSGGENGGGGAGSDYEPGEVRRDAPPYSRSDRFSDSHVWLSVNLMSTMVNPKGSFGVRDNTK